MKNFLKKTNGPFIMKIFKERTFITKKVIIFNFCK